ncbi:MAG: J domain-containing protein [Ilumatobacteraceae bacterium]
MPAGVIDGSTLRLARRGAAGPRGGSPGDLYVHLRVRAHDRYRRVDDDLVTEVAVSIAQASLGTKVLLPTLDGDEDLIVPPGTQPGHEFVLRHRGCRGCRVAVGAI